jgi:hypothetical protein
MNILVLHNQPYSNKKVLNRFRASGIEIGPEDFLLVLKIKRNVPTKVINKTWDTLFVDSASTTFVDYEHYLRKMRKKINPIIKSFSYRTIGQ